MLQWVVIRDWNQPEPNKNELNQNPGFAADWTWTRK